jgi:hypothetical protein
VHICVPLLVCGWEEASRWQRLTIRITAEFIGSILRLFAITTAVTGPPPNNDDLKTGMIGGSRSPLCYASIHFV